MQIFFTDPDVDTTLLDGLVTLPEAARNCLASSDLTKEMPFVLSGSGAFDHSLNAFLRSLPTTGVNAENSWRAYAQQVVLASEYITGPCGRASLFAGTNEDFNGYKQARRGNRMPQVCAKTWNLQVAALEKAFQWRAREVGTVETPFMYREQRQLVNGHIEVRDVNALYEKVVADDVERCISLEEYVFFRDVGLLGARPDDGLRDDGFSSRNEVRDAAIAELLVTTGMRITECLAMFREELPTVGFAPGRKASEALLQGGTTKGQRPRKVMVAHRVMARYVEPYFVSNRANDVLKAREAGRYLGLRGAYALLAWSGDMLRLQGEEGIVVRRIGLLKPSDRKLIFRCMDGIIHEPMALWCGEDGLPLSSDAVRMAFRRACERCNADGKARRRFGRPMRVSPHTLRHTFAVALLSQRIREAGLSIRRGRSDAAAEDEERMRRVLTDPVDGVRRQLGHLSVETTYRYLTYLEQAKETALAAIQGWDDLLSRDAAATRGRDARA